MGAYEDLEAMLGPDELEELLCAADKLADHLAAEDLHFLRELVRLRNLAKLTQEDVAAAWGGHKTAVSQFERLGHDPRLSTIRRYAAAVGARYTHSVELDTAVHPSARVFTYTPPVSEVVRDESSDEGDSLSFGTSPRVVRA